MNERENRIQYVHNRRIEEETGLDYSEDAMILAISLEEHWARIHHYECNIQEMFWTVVMDFRKEVDSIPSPPARKNIRENSARIYLTAKRLVDYNRMLDDMYRARIPNMRTSNLPGFKYPTEVGQLNIGVQNHSAPQPDDYFKDLKIGKKLMCDDLDHFFDLGELPGFKLPEHQMPNLSIGADVDVNIDSCFGKYLPAIFETKQDIGKLTVGGVEKGIYGDILSNNFGTATEYGDMGELGEAAKKAADLMTKAKESIDKATASINDAIDFVQNTANQALSSSVGAIQGAANEAINRVLGSSGTGGILATAKELKEKAAPYIGAVTTAASVAIGSISFFNKARDMLGNDLSKNIDSFASIKDRINKSIKSLGEGSDFDNPSIDAKVKENIRQKLQEANIHLGNTNKNLNQVQNFLDNIHNRKYTYINKDGKVTKKYLTIPTDDSRKQKYSVDSSVIAQPMDREMLYCHVPRNRDHSFAHLVNKFQTNPERGSITNKTTAKDAQLRALEFWSAKMEETNIKREELTKTMNNQVCRTCTAENRSIPTPIQKRIRDRENLVSNLSEVIKSDLIKKGVKSSIAEQLSESKAENDITIKLLDKEQLPKIPDTASEDGTTKTLQEIHNEVSEMLGQDIQLLKETLLRENPCFIEPDYTETDNTINTLPDTSEVQLYIDNVINQRESSWVLVSKGVKLETGGKTFSVDTYTKDSSKLEFRYLVIDGAYVVTYLNHLLDGLPETEAQNITAELVKSYVDLHIYRDGKFINRLTYLNKCDMLKDLSNNRIQILDLVNNIVTSPIAKIKEKSNKHITLTNNLTSDEIIVPVPPMFDPEIIPSSHKDYSEGIEMGSRICDEIIYYLIDKSDTVRFVLDAKGIKDIQSKYEYIKYIFLPNNQHLYEKAIHLCNTGQFQDFDYEPEYLPIKPTEPTEDKQQYFMSLTKVPEYRYIAEEMDIVLPDRVLNKIPADLINKFTNDDEAIYIEVHLSEQTLPHYKPVNIKLQPGVEVVTNILSDSEDKILVRGNDGRLFYTMRIDKLVYETNDNKKIIEIF